MTSKYTRNHGRRGYVYVLTNDALQSGLFKIGQSTRSGKVRAAELNREATTGLPAEYRCVYEMFTQDCGRAELEVHRQLASFRRGKWGQEFFAVDLATATSVIAAVCERQAITQVDEQAARDAVGSETQRGSGQSSASDVAASATGPAQRAVARELDHPLSSSNPARFNWKAILVLLCLFLVGKALLLVLRGA